MVTTVPSRFAVLSVDDDDHKPTRVKKILNTKTNSKVKEDKINPLKKDDKKKQNKGKKKKPNADGQQWEQWKKKDTVVIEETYKQELHEAILLSKLSFQEAQITVPSKSENPDNSKKITSKKSKKSTMSLDEFNNLDNLSAPIKESKVEKKNCSSKDPAFFETIVKETNQEIIKEKEKAALKERFNQLDDNIMSAQLRAEIEKRDDVIKELKEEVEVLKQELSNVKYRNKKLYQILQQGEMKDKATVLAEVTKLQEIRDELTSEVTLLHAQLEQERSKTRVSSTDVKATKQSIKKRLASENI